MEIRTKLSKAVNCTCGESLFNEDGKAIRQTIINTDGDSLFILCLKCKAHTRVGKFEAGESPPEQKEPAKKTLRSKLKIVYIQS